MSNLRGIFVVWGTGRVARSHVTHSVDMAARLALLFALRWAILIVFLVATTPGTSISSIAAAFVVNAGSTASLPVIVCGRITIGY